MRSTLIAACTAGLTVVLGGAAGAADAWGTVKGQVTWGGKAPPEETKVDTTKEPACARCNVTKLDYVVGKGGGVKDVFVWLVDASDPKKPKAPPVHPSLKEVEDREVVMDQPCCKFEPRALAIRQGQTVIGKNSSAINHNMKWGGIDNDGDNKLIPAGGKIEIKGLVAARSAVIVQCNIHPWMEARIWVFDHPYFAVTDKDGKFEIKNAPAGRYNVVMWHEARGWVLGDRAGKPVEIPAGKAVEVNEKLTPAGKAE